MKEIVGQRIRNKKQEQGTIVGYEMKNARQYIFVRFDNMAESDKSKKFVFPDSLGEFLFLLDKSFDINALEREKRNQEIESILKKRNIKALFHVTRIENLESIMKNGIVPRSSLPESAFTNDKYRYDGKTNCNCLSVGRPNSKYFTRQINDSTEDLIYICLSIHPSILFDEKTKYYCHHNAATKSISKDLAEGNLNTSNDLEYMFDKVVEATRSNGETIRITRENNIPAYYPTSIQAEILYQGIIDTKHIMNVDFPSEQSLKRNSNILKKYSKRGTVRKYLNF